MRLAWFTPDSAARRGAAAAPPPHAADDLALLVRALRARHQVDLIDARAAHDFVWRQAQEPYDVCVYELDNTPAHQFVWPYLVHYPGVTLLRRLSLRESRGAASPGRDDLQVALLASRIVVVPHAAVAETLEIDCPGARIRHVAPGVEPTEAGGDVVVALEWPTGGAPFSEAIAGFAAGRAVVVFDCLETSDWPSLNPQDWRPRSAGAPMCVSLDLRDEAHSLRLALRRLSADAALRDQIGSAARVWWREHATVAHAVAGMEAVLEEARGLSSPMVGGIPAYVPDDGTTLARRLLSDFALAPTVLGSEP
jgi:hypothetical protein